MRAAELGYATLALTDHDSLSGSLEFAHAAHDAGLRPITGCELTLADGAHLTLLVEDEHGYRNLCRLITAAHRDDRRAPSGDARPGRPPRRGPALPLGLRPPRRGRSAGGRGTAARGRADRPAAARDVRPRPLCDRAATGPTGAATPAATGCSPSWPTALRVRLVGTGDVHAHSPRRAFLQDALVAIRCNTTLDACEAERRGNHESVLRAPDDAARLFAARGHPRRGRGGRSLPVRPDPRPGLPLSRLLRYRRAGPGGAGAAVPGRARPPLRRHRHGRRGTRSGSNRSWA